MITVTVSEYFEVWEKLLPSFLPFSVIIFVTWVVIFSSPLVFSSWYPINRYQDKLRNRSAISVLSFKGWVRLYFYLLLYLLFSTIVLIPVISLFLILTLEIPITVFQWFLFCLFFPAIVYLTVIMKWHYKFSFPQYYILNNGVGFRQFNNDIIIPYGALVALFVDNLHLRAAIVFNYRLVYPWIRKKKLYFQFISTEELSDFRRCLLEKVSLPLQEEKLTPLIIKLFPFTLRSPQLINESSLNDLLPEKTQRILSILNQSYQPHIESVLKISQEKEPVANFCYNCGQPNPNKTKFCTYCGTALFLPLKALTSNGDQDQKE